MLKDAEDSENSSGTTIRRNRNVAFLGRGPFATKVKLIATRKTGIFPAKKLKKNPKPFHLRAPSALLQETLNPKP